VSGEAESGKVFPEIEGLLIVLEGFFIVAELDRAITNEAVGAGKSRGNGESLETPVLAGFKIVVGIGDPAQAKKSFRPGAGGIGCKSESLSIGGSGIVKIVGKNVASFLHEAVAECDGLAGSGGFLQYCRGVGTIFVCAECRRKHEMSCESREKMTQDEHFERKRVLQ
jgi:hypothetical protein